MDPPRLLSPGNLLAALAIIAAIALVLLRPPTGDTSTASPAPDPSLTVLLELQTKLLAGVARIDRQRALAELELLDGFKATAPGRRALASFHAYVRPPTQRGEALLLLPPEAERDPLDHLVAQAIQSPSAISPETRARLLQEMGWFARLLFAASDEEVAHSVAAEISRAMTLASLASLFLILALVTGLGLFFLALIRAARGSLRFRLQPAPEHAHLYFQSFALYLWGMILISSLLPWAGLAASALAITLSTLLALCYPLLRGASFPAWRSALGMHSGSGFFREIAAGVAAYLALLPLLGLGLALTLLLQKLGSHSSGEPPSPISHPIYGIIPGASTAQLALIFLLASVLAPLAEEIMFRGALYQALRSHTGRLTSLLLMAFVFAAVHPQGIFAIPSLMAIAISFGLMREWRSSLIAGIVTHGLHNGALLLATVALLH